MANYSIVIFILAIMMLLSTFAERIKIPYPVLLIIGGIAVGFVPSIPHIEIAPDVIFLIFLPPLLYDAAFNISFKDFKTNGNTIGTLAISLVFITTVGIAVTAHFLMPGISWPLCFVIGSILSATDAVSAISITKGLGLSHKTSTILEGESLINDASALVAYKFAVAAVSGTAFIIWKAGWQFLVLMAGGFVIGVVMGRILMMLLKMSRGNYNVAISFMLLMPFVTYLVAEEFHVSGVIAVVVLGLGISRFSRQVFSEKMKKEMNSIWNIIIFLLNGLIFLLIGLHFPYVIKMINKSQIWPLIGLAFIITIVALVLRMARVFLQQINLQRVFQKKKGRITEDALLDAKTSLIISWSGMRGIVSLATALALPETVDNAPFPLRSTIIFISVAVVLFTIVGQGMTLPMIVKLLQKKDGKQHRKVPDTTTLINSNLK